MQCFAFVQVSRFPDRFRMHLHLILNLLSLFSADIGAVGQYAADVTISGVVYSFDIHIFRLQTGAQITESGTDISFWFSADIRYTRDGRVRY